MMLWNSSKKYVLNRRHSSHEDEIPLLQSHDYNHRHSPASTSFRRRSKMEPPASEELAQSCIDQEDITQSSPALLDTIVPSSSKTSDEDPENLQDDFDLPPPIPPRRPPSQWLASNSRSQSLPRIRVLSTARNSSFISNTEQTHHLNNFQLPPRRTSISISPFHSRLNRQGDLPSSCPQGFGPAASNAQPENHGRMSLVDYGDNSAATTGSFPLVSFWNFYHRTDPARQQNAQVDDPPPSYDEAMRMSGNSEMQLLD